MEKEILLIFKTHLDVGFTDYSKKIVDNYLNIFIPNAIKVGYELKDTKTPFIWTTGSWLLWEALKQDDGTVAKAIEDGIISWHGLPFTTHTELMNKALFEYGVSLSEQLDKRFGRKTIAAKMTDVPGHTLGMVPILQKHRIEFLHIGVNGATPVPPIPPVFRWKCGDAEITVMYQGDYGTTMEFDDFIICFGHTGDNCGPQSGDAIVQLYEELQQKYPGSSIKPATLNDIAVKARGMKDLPVINQEIGDTWIHGAGTDPKKVGRYREMLRWIEQNDIHGADLSDSLLMIPEHTWGMCVKRFYTDVEHYDLASFQATKQDTDRTIIEASWQEQREYLNKAEQVLGIQTDYTLTEPNLDGFHEIDIPILPVALSWQLFDRSDYERYREKYLRLPDVPWAIWDFTKVGLPAYEGGIYQAQVTRSFARGEKLLFRLDFPQEVTCRYGLPHVWIAIEGEAITVSWFTKSALRLPNAFWLKFIGCEENWELHKMGEWISPFQIIGSPLISAVDKGVRNSSTEIVSYDACLVAPFGRRLLDYDLHPKTQDLYFNLYNNIWNTNFPMWYSDDTRFRFVKKKVEREEDVRKY